MTRGKFNLSSLTASKSKNQHREPGFPKIAGARYLHVLAEILATRSADWYLEIGSRTGDSLARVPCNFVAIDPEFALSNPVFQNARQMHFFQMTSDDFFAERHLPRLGITPDVAFIDGMHHFEFALRDFMNCEAAMDPDGVIVLHDVCPSSTVMASRAMTELEARRAWTGDVWKVVVALQDHRPDLDIHILDASKTGLCVIKGLNPSDTTLAKNLDTIIAQYIDTELDAFGPAAYYDRFALELAEGFAARVLA